MRQSLEAILFLCLLLSSCQSGKPAHSAEPSGKTIGSAQLTSDGILEVMLRAESEDGAVGDAFFAYRKGTPDYEAMMKHIGGLKRGESKPVPAYP